MNELNRTRKRVIILLIIGVIILFIGLIFKSFVDEENAELRSVIKVELVNGASIG
jgi:hypothetical protein